MAQAQSSPQVIHQEEHAELRLKTVLPPSLTLQQVCMALASCCSCLCTPQNLLDAVVKRAFIVAGDDASKGQPNNCCIPHALIDS